MEERQLIYGKIAAIMKDTMAITKVYNKGKSLGQLDDYIKSHFRYNPNTGVIIRNDRNGGCGSLDSKGYLILKIKGRQFKSHRIAWFLYYGEMPDMEIDHINRNKTDNRICNLRVSDRGDNNRNRHQMKNKDTGYIGIHRCKHYKTISYNFEVRYRGKLYKFYTLEEAVKFRKDKELAL